MSDNSRRVYSTDSGDLRHEKPAQNAPIALSSQPIKVVADSKGRKGKTVTLISSIPVTERKDLCKQLKQHCGSGGTIDEDRILIQGDHVEKITAYLKAHGFKI